MLERLCLEGSRRQAKYAVHALAAITKDDGLKSLSVLYKVHMFVIWIGSLASPVVTANYTCTFVVLKLTPTSLALLLLLGLYIWLVHISRGGRCDFLKKYKVLKCKNSA